MEGLNRDAFPTNPKIPEQSELSDHDQALQAFNHLRSATAEEALGEFRTNPAISLESFLAALDRFNALPAEERGKGNIETKTLENRRVRVAAVAHGSMSAFPYEIHQHEDGSLTLHSPMQDLA